MTAVTERMGGGSCGLVEQPEPDSDGWLFSGAGCGGGNGSGADCARAAVGDPPAAPAPVAGPLPGTVVLPSSSEWVVGPSPITVTITVDLSVVPLGARIVAAYVTYHVNVGTAFTITDPGGTASQIDFWWSNAAVALLNAAMGNPAWAYQAQLAWDSGGDHQLFLEDMSVDYVPASGT